MKDEQAN